MSNQRLREALAGVPSTKEKGTPVSDGILTVTPDSPEAAEWRNKSVLDCVATTSTYLEDDTDGRKPRELFGKFTWKIENYSEIGKRELRSTQFDVGEFKWYILVYPQGCDVCNHLSLFLCVADYDKLLPGWSHFAQFTIAVVNKDPKKSKYSDTLHRFCKKEHDWGWKKFMEQSKLQDGFTVSDTLVIKAQVQVILDKPSRPFRCLDPQYRRELVRVYLTNVESICRRFCDDTRTKLSWLKEEHQGFAAWWRSLGRERQQELVADRGEAILKGLVKQFFNEKEVTSTLVMDALYSGCRQLEEAGRFLSQGKSVEGEPRVLVRGDRNAFYFGMDALDLSQRACAEYIPASRDDKVLPAGADVAGLRSGSEGDTDLRRDSVERDEKRLAELGRRTVEMYAMAHVFHLLEAKYRDAQALERAQALIDEEEEQGRLQDARAQARLAADKEKRAKKKERKKAKKDAEKAKRDAEEEERRVAEAARREQELQRLAEASERRRQEEAVEQELQQQQAASRQRAQERAGKRQQQAADAMVAAAQAAAASAAAAPSAHAVDAEQPQPSGSGRDERDLPSRQCAANGISAVSTSSTSSAAARGNGGGVWLDHRGRASGCSSPAAGSLADSSHEPTTRSVADSSGEADTSDTCSIDSSKAVGPSQGYGNHHAHHGAANGPSRSGAGNSAANGHLHHPSSHPPPPPPPPPPAPGPSSSQQPQQQSSLSEYIPSGYAAAVAHRPAPAASSSAVDPSRRTREQALEEEVGALRKRVRMLENTLAERGQQLAERVMEVSNLRAQLSEVQAAGQEQQQAAKDGLAAMQQQHAALQQQHAALQQRHQQLQQEYATLQQRHQQQGADAWAAEGPSGRGGAWSTQAAQCDSRLSTSSTSSEGGGASTDAAATPSARPAPWAAVTAGTPASYSAAAAAGKGDSSAAGAGPGLKAGAATSGLSASEEAGPSSGVVDRRATSGSAATSSGGSYADSVTAGLRPPAPQQQQHGAGSSAGPDKGGDADVLSTPFARAQGGQGRPPSGAGASIDGASTSSSSKAAEAPPADKAPGGGLAGSSTPRYASAASAAASEGAAGTSGMDHGSRGGSRQGISRSGSLNTVGSLGSSGGVGPAAASTAAAPPSGGADGASSAHTAAAKAVSRAASDPGDIANAAASSSSSAANVAETSTSAAAGSGAPGRGSLEESIPPRPASSTGSDTGLVSAMGSYMSSMAGVLHGNGPGQSSLSSAFSGGGLAGNLQGDGVGSSSTGTGLGPLSSSLGLGSMPKHLGGRNMGGDHGYAAFGRGGMGFGSMAAAAAAASKAASPGPGNRNGAMGNIEDANLDGFVHMNMIDDLLTE